MKFHEDLDWYAFLYVADELDSQQRAEFENLLLEDQEAREAVAGAVDLSNTVAASYAPAVQPRATINWLRSASLIGLGAAACLVLMLLADRLIPTGPSLVSRSSGDSVDPSSPSSPELAIMWSQTRQHIPATADASLLEDSAEDELASPWLGNQDSLDDPLQVPTWMTMALSELSTRKPSPSTGPSENTPTEN